MTKANKEVFTKVGLWIALAMIPTGLYFLFTGEPMINAIIETNVGKLLLILSISGIAKACMDTVSHHYSKSIFTKYNEQFFNPIKSWRNKYSDADKLIRKKILGINTPVFVTDFWHLSQSIYLWCLFLCLPLYQTITDHWYYDVLILRVWFGIYFYGFYNYILLKSEK